jgi:hypothetical protein
MTIPTAIAINSFTGPVTLDDNQQEAWFDFTTAPGQNGTILMVRDPSPGGVPTQADSVAMWSFYSAMNWVSGAVRTVSGHSGYPPNGNQPLLFVVRG